MLEFDSNYCITEDWLYRVIEENEFLLNKWHKVKILEIVRGTEIYIVVKLKTSKLYFRKEETQTSATV